MIKTAKDIILVDNELKIIDHILNLTDWNVKVLVTVSPTQKYFNTTRIGEIYKETDFWLNDNLEGIDFELLKYFSYAQLKCENTFHREFDDFQIGKWNYYRGFAMIYNIFLRNKIDCVIIKGPNHGYTFDRLMVEMASFYKIRSYNIELHLPYGRSIYDNLNQCQLLVSSKNDAFLDKSLYYTSESGNGGWNVEFPWKYIYGTVEKDFGKLGLEIIKCIRYRNLGIRDIFGRGIIPRLFAYLKWKVIEKYYIKKSVALCDKKKFICYMMHMEPEAVVAGVPHMDSQLVALKMLSDLLPNDWMLYVKEHPDQFKINSVNFYDFIFPASVYKSKAFYSEILKMKNVRFLRREISSESVIKHCSGIATLNGTVAFEAIEAGKPVLVFGGDRYIYSKSKAVFNIHSYEDCRKAIYKIVSGQYFLRNDLRELALNYLVDFTDETEGYKKATLIIKDAIEHG